jgi:hypothetical protein
MHTRRSRAPNGWLSEIRNRPTDIHDGDVIQSMRTWSPDPRQHVELRWCLKTHKHSTVVGRVAHNSRPPYRHLRHLRLRRWCSQVRLPSGRSSCGRCCCRCGCCCCCHVGASWGWGTHAGLRWGPLGSWSLLVLQVESGSINQTKQQQQQARRVGMCAS